MQYTINDGGVRNFSIAESNDCTVRAYAIARGITYLDAHRALESVGRRPHHGINFRMNAPLLPGLTEIKLENKHRVCNMVPHFPTGRYIFRIRKHVFAVVDGVAHDWCRGTPDGSNVIKLRNCLVTNVWKVEPAIPLVSESLNRDIAPSSNPATLHHEN